jgi:16S rRNA (guanine966-N2)-methyltransferase
VRVIAGEWRGRKLKAPPGRLVRPTLDRVREAWMSILQTELPGARVLDLFAGSGALGLEALSRGASHADFVERDPKVLPILRDNIEFLEAVERATVIRADVGRFLDEDRTSYDLAFADPPYEGDHALRIVERWLEKPFSRLLSVEHRRGAMLPSAEDTRLYGDSAITFYRALDGDGLASINR